MAKSRRLTQFQRELMRTMVRTQQAIVRTMEEPGHQSYTLSGSGQGIRPATIDSMVRKGVLVACADGLEGFGPPQTYRVRGT